MPDLAVLLMKRRVGVSPSVIHEVLNPLAIRRLHFAEGGLVEVFVVRGQRDDIAAIEELDSDVPRRPLAQPRLITGAPRVIWLQLRNPIRKRRTSHGRATTMSGFVLRGK